MTTAVAAALAEYKPQLVTLYTAMVTNLHARMVKRLGPELKGVGNSWEFARTYYNLVDPCCDNRRQLDPTRLATVAQAWADAAVLAWQAKVEAKLGEMVQAEAKFVRGGSFVITGTRGGRSVRIEQQMIVKTSSKGTVFNQFPARIYLDGKFTSEAAYKRAFAG